MNLRRKLLLMFFGLAVIPITIAAAAVTVGALRYTEKRTQEELRQQLDALSYRIHKVFEAERFVMSHLAREWASLHRLPPELADTPSLASLSSLIDERRFTRGDSPRLPRRLVVLEPGRQEALVYVSGFSGAGGTEPSSIPLRALPPIYPRIRETPALSAKHPFLTTTDPTGPVLVIAVQAPLPGDRAPRIAAMEYPLLESLERLTHAALSRLESSFVAAKPYGSAGWLFLYHSDPTRIGLPIESSELPEETLELLRGRISAAASVRGVRHDGADDALPTGAAIADTRPGTAGVVPRDGAAGLGLRAAAARRGDWECTRVGDSICAAGLHPATGWVLGASASFAARFEPLRQSIILFLVLFGLMALLVTLGILLATHGISAAVETIARDTDAIAKGDFGRSVQIRRSDEFGAIAERINRMAQDLLISSESRAIARISARLVHDLKGVASQMNLLLYNLKENYDDKEFRAEFFDLMRSLVKHVESIILQLRREDRTRDVAWTQVDPDEVVSRILNSPSVTSHESIAVQTKPGAASPAVADPELLEGVLRNIVSNAVEAMATGGTLTVRTGTLETSDPAGPTHFVEVGDTGPGMSQDFIDHELFRPVSTTKSGGTGLGMYTAREITGRLGGRIRVESREGRGTRVRVEFGRPDLGQPRA
ncbi:MAG: ATP-binding protein [Candidatus Krumholzibacteriia bacterium]